MKWKSEEKEFLIRNYSIKGLKWCFNHLKKSKSSVSLMANRLNLKSIKIIKKNEDDKFLKENYKMFGANYCAKFLKKNIRQIIKRACVLKINPSKKWTKEEEAFLIKYYPSKGSEFCKNNLGIDNKKITLKANKLGLTLTKEASVNRKKEVMLKFTENRAYDSFNVNPEHFINIKKPEIAYTLGFLWADGHVKKYKNSNTIKIDLNIKDSKEIKKVLKKTGKWNYYLYERIDNRNNKKYMSYVITTNNRPIVDFLISNDYSNKSILSPHKILNHIPDNMKHYFFRGLSDGDGCFFYNKTQSVFLISGSYMQDWTIIESLFNKLNINYRIKRTINKLGQKSSIIISTDKKSVINFGNYIYKNFINEKIGFNRKYKKFVLIKNR